MQKRQKMATALAIFFHMVGLIGILFFNRDFFIQTTSLNLLLMFALLLYTRQEYSKGFIFFIVISVATGILVEIIGINTAMLFGNYTYGDVLGIKYMGVPLIIGINWFIVMYCCGTCTHRLLDRVVQQMQEDNNPASKKLRSIAVVADAAVLAVLFDWLMEPVAVKLGYWSWASGKIPFYNYVCWLLVSILLQVLFRKLKIGGGNKFAVHLLLVQAMFFLLLRTFL